MKPVLQFGLDAVVEENMLTGFRVNARLTRLQFGLDAVVEENERHADRQGHAEGASIRPRRCRRGELTRHRPAGKNGETLQFGLDAVVEENFPPTGR